jgi:hypothetical protein
MTEKYSAHYINYCKKTMITPNLQFITWINTIEQKINKKIGLNLLDLPDEPYMDMFVDSIQPADVVDHILEDLSLDLAF